MKVSEMFPRKYATGPDLANKPVSLTIRTVQREQLHAQPGAAPQDKFVVYFVNAHKGVILCRTLAAQIAEAVGSEDTEEWIGKRVTLFPVPMTVAGKSVVAIRARKATNGESQPPATLLDPGDDGDPTAA